MFLFIDLDPFDNEEQVILSLAEWHYTISSRLSRGTISRFTQILNCELGLIKKHMKYMYI